MITRQFQTPIMHRTVRQDGTVYLGGIIADDLADSMEGQARQVLAKLGELLQQAGSDRSAVLSATVYITDMARKGEMNGPWVEWFEPAHLPARATIGVSDLGEGVLIEVVCTAAVVTRTAASA